MKKKIALVLLAAGDSRRFDGNKLLSEWNGKPMFRAIVDQVHSLPEGIFTEQIVVTQYDVIAEELQPLGFRVVRNQESCLGISHSIHLALDQSSEDTEIDAVCFAVCDQPWLTAGTIGQLIQGWEDSGKGIGCLVNQSELGNPVVFSRKYFPELYQLSGDVGGKRVVQQHLDDIWTYEPAEARELEDIDERSSSTSVVPKNRLAIIGFSLMIAGPLIIALAGEYESKVNYLPEFVANVITWTAIILPAIGAICSIVALCLKSKTGKLGRALAIVTLIMCNPMFYFYYFIICAIASTTLAGLSWM